MFLFKRKLALIKSPVLAPHELYPVLIIFFLLVGNDAVLVNTLSAIGRRCHAKETAL